MASDSGNSIPKPPILRADDIQASLATRPHPYDPEVKRSQTSLSEKTGLKESGVHLCKLPPSSRSSILHYHHNDEEWIYVLSGSGRVLLLYESDHEQKKQPEEFPLSKGDFVGFPSLKGRQGEDWMAHYLVTGEGEELEYLCGGSRKEADVCSYPLMGGMAIINRGYKAGNLLVKTDSIIKRS